MDDCGPSDSRPETETVGPTAFFSGVSSVGAIGERGRIGGQEALDDGAGSWVGGKRRAFVGFGHEHVAVHAPAGLFPAALQEHCRAAPEGCARTEAVVVLMRGLDAAYLEKRTRAKDAVLVRLPKIAVKAGCRIRRRSSRAHGAARRRWGGLPVQAWFRLARAPAASARTQTTRQARTPLARVA